MKPSTRRFIRDARSLPGYGFFDWLHGYIYLRWPYLYIGVGTGEHRASRVLSRLWGLLQRLFRPLKTPADIDEKQAFADTYHGKVMPLETASRLVTLQQPVDLRDLEQVIPYSKARDIVLQHPDHIVALDCPCRLARKNPCLPLDVCLIIGEPFAGFVSEHHRGRSRWISQPEALAILRAEQDRGHVHHAFFKDAMLGRFYAICNCCSCCCGAMQAMRNGTPMLAASGYVARSRDDLCTGCSACVKRCQFGAVRLVNGKARVDTERCMGCGVCAAGCTQSAVSLVLDRAKGKPLRAERLLT